MLPFWDNTSGKHHSGKQRMAIFSRRMCTPMIRAFNMRTRSKAKQMHNDTSASHLGDEQKLAMHIADTLQDLTYMRT